LPGPKFEYKLRWFERLRRYATDLAAAGQPVALCGDYNVVPTDIDAVVPKRWVFDAVFFPESRNEYRLMLAEGWTDALRKVHPQKGIYTYWNFAFRGGYDKAPACEWTTCCSTQLPNECFALAALMSMCAAGKSLATMRPPGSNL